jgi:CheY-like chemotaxis protein
MELNKVVGRIECELAAGFPELHFRQALTEADVNAYGPEIEDDLIAALMSLVRASGAQSVDVATGFRSRNLMGACADVVEYSVLTVTMSLKPNVMAEYFAAPEHYSPELQLLTQTVENSGGRVETSVADLSRLRLTICLPYCDDTADASAEKSAGETVLLVEDEEFVRGVTKEVLEMAGYRVLEATNGETAIAVFDENEGNVDLVLTDVVMPGMNGRDLAEHLSKRRPSLKMLFMSGYTENAVLRRGLEDDCAAYLQKPFALQTLTDKVREVLRGNPVPHAATQWAAVDAGTETFGV